jgi:hypothetical protein
MSVPINDTDIYGLNTIYIKDKNIFFYDINACHGNLGTNMG